MSNARHITFKLQTPKTKNFERSQKEDKNNLHIKEKNIRIKTDLSEIMQKRRKWNKILMC